MFQLKMNKRKNEYPIDVQEASQIKKSKESEKVKKHSLDSDEEDDNENDDIYNVLDEDEIEGEEDGVPNTEDGVRITAFNMREEMEEGHFDKEGHFLWNKDKDIRDNWLDNIDWHQIKPQLNKHLETLGDESDSDDKNEVEETTFNEIESYIKILEFMKPKENITKTLRRLAGPTRKLSSVERLKLKKAGILDAKTEEVTRLTELANEVLNRTGNMDIYQETYEIISNKITESKNKLTKSNKEELDMYSDDFDVKEKKRFVDGSGASTKPEISSESSQTPELMWEYKLTPDSDEINGPYTTKEMQKFVDEGKFKPSAWVRKIGQEQFYTSSRIDFEIYLS